MDLGIEGKWALVCAASKGLGKGCAVALVQELGNGRLHENQPITSRRQEVRKP